VGNDITEPLGREKWKSYVRDVTVRKKKREVLALVVSHGTYQFKRSFQKGGGEKSGYHLESTNIPARKQIQDGGRGESSLGERKGGGVSIGTGGKKGSGSPRYVGTHLGGGNLLAQGTVRKGLLTGGEYDFALKIGRTALEAGENIGRAFGLIGCSQVGRSIKYQLKKNARAGPARLDC